MTDSDLSLKFGLLRTVNKQIEKMDLYLPDLESMCRLCLSADDERFQIFEEGLSNRIIMLSGLDLQSNDTLPKHICKDCRYQLEKSFYFRMIAKQSDSRLRKHIRLVNQNKPSNVLDQSYKDEDMEEFEETYLESYKFFTEAEESIAKLRSDFEIEKTQIIQEEVERILAEQNSVRPTRRSNQKEEKFDNPVVLNDAVESVKKFEGTPRLRRKQTIEYEKMVLANYEIEILHDDGYTFEKQEDSHEVELIEYISEEGQLLQEESDDKDYVPEPTKRKQVFSPTKPKKKVQREYKKVLIPASVVRNQLPHQEPADDYYFRTIEDADEEDLDENGERKIFQCAFENCIESFARRQSCKTHFYNHKATDNLKGFNCKFCGKTFHVASARERHERVHTKEKPFICDFEGCGKGFSQKEMLKRHKIIHLAIEEAPHVCNICEKRFRQREPLRQHINKMHSEDSETQAPSFVCKICQRQFAHSSGLSRHLLLHSGRKFTCEVCDKVFNDQSALKRHGKVHRK